MHLSNNHHSIITTSEVAQICEPLFQRYGLTFFLYARIFDTGKTYGLLTHANYQLHHFEKEYLVTPPIPSKFLQKKFYYILHPNDLGRFNQTYYDFRNYFHLDHHLFMIERYTKFYDLFIFATSPENMGIINFYLNNMEIIENFKFYFLDKAKHLLSEADKHRICLPDIMKPNFGGLDYDLLKNNEKFSSKKPFPVKQYALNSPYHGVYLTAREFDTFKKIAKGFSAKEIAKHMKISHRTVESCINNVRLKLHLNRKSDVIALLKEFNLL